MTRISIFCPAAPGRRFDMDYYLNRHMPNSIARLSAAQGFGGVSVERGIAGGAPGSPAPFVAACHYVFDTLDDFIAAFGPHAAALQDDMPNYTDIETVIQIGEIAIERTAA